MLHSPCPRPCSRRADPGAPALASQSCGASGAVTTLNGSLPDGATYQIQCPAGRGTGRCSSTATGTWYPGVANPAQDVGDPVTGEWLLSHGYALAGSSYATTGWAIQQALPDQIGTLGVFGRTYRTPAPDHRLGTFAGRHHHRGPDPALPGPVQRGAADVRRAVGRRRHLEHRSGCGVRIPAAGRPSVQVVNITNPGSEPVRRGSSRRPPRSRRRRAGPGWPWLRRSPIRRDGSPRCPPNPPRVTSPPRKPTSTCGTPRSTSRSFSPSAPSSKRRAGGNPSWNTGVNYVAQLAKSADAREVRRAVSRGRAEPDRRPATNSTRPRGSAPSRPRCVTWRRTSPSTATCPCRCSPCTPPATAWSCRKTSRPTSRVVRPGR